MTICLPVTEDRALESTLSAHFGSAPAFLLVDTITRACRFLPNHAAHHEHGGCQPLSVFAAEPVDALLVGGIGRGALMKLRAAGVDVFGCDHARVSEALAAFESGALQPLSFDQACGGHGHGPHGHDRV